MFLKLSLSVIFIFVFANLIFAKPFIFVQIADPQIGINSINEDIAKLNKVVEKINLLCPDFLIISGDLTNLPNDKEQIAALKASLARLKVPFHYIPGNHDMRFDEGGIKDYIVNFGKDYYKFEHNNSLFLVVNSVRIMFLTDKNSFFEKVQRNWLNSQLSAAKNMGYNHILILDHIPIFTDDFWEVNKHPNAEHWRSVLYSRRPAYADMYNKYGVEYVISGHNHAERVVEYNNMKLVINTGLGKSDDKKPLGFRIFKVYDNKIIHEYVSLDQIDGKIIL